MLTEKVKREYWRLRGAGWRPNHALHGAKAIVRFEQLEAQGLVKLECVPDVAGLDWGDLEGDCYDVEYPKDTVPGGARTILAQQRAFREKVERDGVWGIVGSYRKPICPHCGDGGDWEHGGSCWGFAGYKDPLDPAENCYVPGIMRETIEALEKQGGAQ